MVCGGTCQKTITADFISMALSINFTRTCGLWADSRHLLAESLERWWNGHATKLHCYFRVGRLADEARRRNKAWSKVVKGAVRVNFVLRSIDMKLAVIEIWFSFCDQWDLRVPPCSKGLTETRVNINGRAQLTHTEIRSGQCGGHKSVVPGPILVLRPEPPLSH